MKCPLCNEEVKNRLPSHFKKSIDKIHMDFLKSQYELGKRHLLEGKNIFSIRDIEEIVLKGLVEGYLYENFKEKIQENGKLNRNKNVSKSKTKGENIRKNKNLKLQSDIENGIAIENKDYVVCKICGKKAENLTKHIPTHNNMTTQKYKELYPGCQIQNETIRNRSRDRMLQNNPNDNPESIERMKDTKAKTKNYRIAKAKAQFASGERVAAKNVGRGLGGNRPDLGHSVRSMWEANMARILQLKGIEYKFEKEAFPFYDQNGNLIDSYLPDFYLPEYNAWLEVKGQMDEISQKKILLFLNEGYRLIIVDGKIYDKLCRKFKHKLNGKWEYSGHNIKTHPELFNKISEEN